MHNLGRSTAGPDLGGSEGCPLGSFAWEIIVLGRLASGICNRSCANGCRAALGPLTQRPAVEIEALPQRLDARPAVKIQALLGPSGLL